MQKTILIVDDDSDDRDLFTQALHEADNSVLCVYATDGHSALSKLGEPGFTIPDYIFLDLNMPMMDGKECLVQLKKLPVIQNVPIIVFTTSGLHEDAKATRSLGASLFFTKPDIFARLVDTVKFILSENWKAPHPRPLSSRRGG